MNRITTCLWFDDQGEAASEFYVSVFPNSRILDIAHYGKAGFDIHGRPEGSVMTVAFEIEGQSFLALNGGPLFGFTPAISLMVNCETQEEIDALWSALSANPQAEQCGWLQDKFGLSWQIVPRRIGRMMTDPDKAKSERVMAAMLQMKKLDIDALQAAYAQA